jgi:hypothetical protein
MLNRPAFLETTFDDRGDGFFFSGEPPADIEDLAHLGDSNYWIVLGCALARLRRGDFGVFGHVVNVLARTDDGDFWNSCSLLFAFAAPSLALESLSRVFPDHQLRVAPELVRLYCQTLIHSMRLSQVERVLHLYERARDEDVRVLVADYLSHVLEDEPGPVGKGPAVKLPLEPPPPFGASYYDYGEYLEVVRSVRDRLASGIQSIETPILGGSVFTIDSLARRIIKHAHEGEDSTRTNFERMAFEATTGIPCAEFFTGTDHPQFRPLAAAAIAEDFLHGNTSGAFPPGVRCFFGHPIPT